MISYQANTSGSSKRKGSPPRIEGRAVFRTKTYALLQFGVSLGRLKAILLSVKD